MMTLATKVKIEEARRMMEHYCRPDGTFWVMMYEEARREWPKETPAWSTIKKYAEEAGLQTTTVYLEWHSDGSFIAEFCRLEDGEMIPTSAYFFKK